MTAVAIDPPKRAKPADRAEVAPLMTAADWLHSIGNVPLERIIFDPPPGSATVADVVRLERHHDMLAELVSNTLLEKVMGYREGLIAIAIASVLRNFVKENRLALINGADGMLKMPAGNIRIPDVSVVRRSDLPGGVLPDDSVPMLPPAIAVEVLSEGNTDREMEMKIAEYFESGSELIWLVNPADRTVRIYDAPNAPARFRQITDTDTLDGGKVLPGFEVKVADIFDV